MTVPPHDNSQSLPVTATGESRTMTSRSRGCARWSSRRRLPIIVRGFAALCVSFASMLTVTDAASASDISDEGKQAAIAAAQPSTDDSPPTPSSTSPSAPDSADDSDTVHDGHDLSRDTTPPPTDDTDSPSSEDDNEPSSSSESSDVTDDDHAGSKSDETPVSPLSDTYSPLNDLSTCPAAGQEPYRVTAHPGLVGWGWKPNRTVFLADFDRRGASDAALIDDTGKLHLYLRSGDTFRERITLGPGWLTIPTVLSGVDFTGDGWNDLITITTDGTLWVYPGTGRGVSGPRRIGHGWQQFDSVTAIPHGPNRQVAFIATSGTATTIYPTDGHGGFLPPVAGAIPCGGQATIAGPVREGYSSLVRINGASVELLATSDGVRFSSAGILTGIDVADATLLGVNSEATDMKFTIDVVSSTGDFSTYSASRPPREVTLVANTSHIAVSRATTGRGFPHSGLYYLGDFTGDGVTNYAIVRPDGALMMYQLDHIYRIYSMRQIGQGWGGFVEIHTGVDFDGNSTMDIVARTRSGTLILYPGNGAGGFAAPRQIGNGWSSYSTMRLISRGPNGAPAIYGVDADDTVWLYKTNGRGRFTSRSWIDMPANVLAATSVVDDWNRDGRSDLLYRSEDGELYLMPQDRWGAFPRAEKIGYGFTRDYSPLLPGPSTASRNTVVTVSSDRQLLVYPYRRAGVPDVFGYAPRVQVSGSWLTHPMTWAGQPDDSTCGPTSMYMVLNYLGPWRSRYDGQALSVWALRGRAYANVGGGWSGGTSWEDRSLSVGLNRWRGTNDYRQQSFPSGAAFDSAVRQSFVTGRPVLVDTVENYGGPHYNGHSNGFSSHIIVAYRYNTANGTVGFLDPGGPGSAISGYSASRAFDYSNASRFAVNFLGNYGGGGHGMVY